MSVLRINEEVLSALEDGKIVELKDSRFGRDGINGVVRLTTNENYAEPYRIEIKESNTDV